MRSHWVNDWTALIKRKEEWNWQSFTFIEAYVERDNVCGTFDVRLALLGLGFAVVIPLPERLRRKSATRERLLDMADDLPQMPGLPR